MNPIIRKIVLLPINENRLKDLYLTSWSLKHIEGISVCAILHNLSSEAVLYAKEILKNIKVDFQIDNSSNNLSEILNKAQMKIKDPVVFYRLDCGDIVHRRRFDFVPNNNKQLYCHSGLIKYSQGFIVKRYRGFLMQLLRNSLIHSSFIFNRLEYDTNYKYGQDYELSLRCLMVNNFFFLNRILVLKNMSVKSNTIVNKGISIDGTIKAKKETYSGLKGIIIRASLVVEIIKKMLWNLKR